MATSSISGLASGLDTATIITQLMQLEAIPQSRLKTQQSTQRTALTALQSLNTDLVSLATRAEALARPATWQTLRATTSSSDITATLGTSPTVTRIDVKVDQLAVNHQLAFASAAALTDAVAGTAVRLTTHDGVVHDLTTGGGTLGEVVTAINASTAQTGVTATAVRVGTGSYRLLVQSSATGKDTDFTPTSTDGSALLGGATTRDGADAQVSLGLGITASSSTNTFTDLVPGLSLTLSSSAEVGTTTTVTVAQDPSSAQASVKALVDQLNGLLTTIDTRTAYGTGTTGKGVLAGDAAARGVRDKLLSTVFGTGTTSMAGIGIQTDRYGKLVLDEAAFAKAYVADPAAVAAQFTRGTAPATPGWAARLQDVAKAASDPVSGTVTSAVTGRQSTIDQLGDDIDAWDLRLELRRTSLTRQYTALETALSTLQSQGSWLSSQISSLGSASS